MIIIHLLIVISFALLITLAGLFALAKSKKDGHGKIYTITSYLTVTCGMLLFVGSIVAASLMACCHKSDCHKGARSCHTEIRSNCDGGSCKSGKKTDCKKTVCKKSGNDIEKEVIVKIIETEGE